MKINRIIILAIFILHTGILCCQTRQKIMIIEPTIAIQSLAILYEIENSTVHLVHLEKEERKEYMNNFQNNGDFFLRCETWSVVENKDGNNQYFQVIALLHFIPEKTVDVRDQEHYRIESKEEFFRFYHNKQTEYGDNKWKEWQFVGYNDEDNVCAKILDYYWKHQQEIVIINDKDVQNRNH